MEFKNYIIKFFFACLVVASPFSNSFAQAGSDRVRMLVNTLENDSDFKVRMAAAQALGKMADGTVADWMIRAFRHDDNDAVRLAILYSVSDIPDEKVVPPLMELANQEILSAKELLVIEQILWNYRKIFNVSAWITEAINSNDMATKKTSIWILGIIGDPDLAPVFQKLSKHPSEDIQVAAFESLAKVGDTKALEVCQSELNISTVPQVQRAAQHCVQSNQIYIQNPNAPSFRKKMNMMLGDVKQNSIKPIQYLTYLNKNLNQREVDVALQFLQPQSAPSSSEKSTKLIERETMKTFQLVVDMQSKYEFDSKDLEVLKTIVRENSNGIEGCYLHELSHSPTLRGDIQTFFRIMGSGQVAETKITSSTMKNLSVENCILEQMRLFDFPSLPLDHVNLVYTFSFAPPAKTQVMLK